MHTLDNTEALVRALNAPRRNHYFYGKRMDVQHFEMEQGYGKLKQWLLNRLTLGKGVLCGLRVSVDGERVCVDPGVAIDGWGREIVVPVRSCIDPLAIDDSCCGQHAKPAPAAHDAAAERPKDGVFTLWVCYHECLADYQAALVADCATRDHCAAGTVVESFCLKTTPGLPPLLGDPDWCALLWKKQKEPAPADNANEHQPANPNDARDVTHLSMLTHAPAATSDNTNALGLTAEDLKAIRNAMQSRRHALCEAFADTCEVDGDPCVPLAVIIVRDGKLFVESCLVRPRIYSNAKLLDLILCLAERIDECCGKHEPQVSLRVSSIEFLNRTDGVEAVVASMQTPLQDTQIAIDRNTNAIRIRFNKPLATNQHKPTTHGMNDADFKAHNVLVLPDRPLNHLEYVPGSVTLEAPDTVRFDLYPEGPYVRRGRGWQKGRYQIVLRGTEHLDLNQQALADAADAALDGEPVAPANGVMSGDGTAGGDFNAYFIIGGAPQPQPQETMRVRSVEFLSMPAGAAERVITAVKSPLENVALKAEDGLKAIRVRFSKPFAQDAHKPTTHAAGDADYGSRNVQVLTLSQRGGVQTFVPGVLKIDSADTFTFVLNIPTPPTRGPLPWPTGTFRLFLRGNDDQANERPALTDTSGVALDGEPAAPANGVISGDGTGGGDFTATFTVQAAV
jgi:hypothetical protein